MPADLDLIRLLEEDPMHRLMKLAGEAGRLINGLAASLTKCQIPEYPGPLLPTAFCLLLTASSSSIE
jgi:hypothetical protein